MKWCLNTGKVIRKRNKKFLKLKFWGLCIPIRIGLGLAIWYISQINKKADLTIAIIVTILALVAIYNNFRCLGDKTVWWSRYFELFVSVMLVVFGSLSIGFWNQRNNDENSKFDSKFLCIIIFIDVVVGIILGIYKLN